MLSFGKLIPKRAQLCRRWRMLEAPHSQCKGPSSLDVCENSVCTYQSDNSLEHWRHFLCPRWVLCIPTSSSPEYLPADSTDVFQHCGFSPCQCGRDDGCSISIFPFMLATSHRQTDSFSVRRKPALFFRCEQSPGNYCLSTLTETFALVKAPDSTLNIV